VDTQREFIFTDRDFECIRELVTQNTGIYLADHKKDMVYGRLSRRLRKLRLTEFAEYCDVVRRGDGKELGELVNAITTNLTSFFREPHHFDYLSKTVFPELIASQSSARKIRIWSAGCSTGEEPYSIAIIAHERGLCDRQWDVDILATDIDSSVLQTAAHGIYDSERVGKMANERLKRWFHRGTGANVGRVKVKRSLQKIVDFRQLNLMEPWPMEKPFDIIFCRNVTIYFDKTTQRELFNRFADILVDGGWLFIGHSESLFRVCDRFYPMGQTIYRKRT
jgi:chemotaxis protein methyltransferase CheR